MSNSKIVLTYISKLSDRDTFLIASSSLETLTLTLTLPVDFTRGVEDGLRISKRIYFGKDRSVAPPKMVTPMTRSSVYPTSPMVYGVISNPGIVDNPDVPSYQPHVHGKCNPPALIPLQMNGIELEIGCCLDTTFVTISGSWWVHCVMGSAACDVRLAVPIGPRVLPYYFGDDKLGEM